jgi:anti-sigma regulatory factor (Ser/Thr protein kinase)
VVENQDEMLELTLGGGKEAPAGARMALAGLNGSLAGLAQSVRLLVSELVTNAVRFGLDGPDATVSLSLTSSNHGVHVEVLDPGTGFEPEREGFGLMLLNQLADRWGVTVDRGTRVWFEIDRPTESGR